MQVGLESSCSFIPWISGVVFPTLRMRSDSKLKRCNGEERTMSLLRYEELFANKVSDLHGITYLTMNTCFRNEHVPMRRSLKVNEYEIFVKGRETLSHGWSLMNFNIIEPLIWPVLWKFIVYYGSRNLHRNISVRARLSSRRGPLLLFWPKLVN